MNYSCDDQTCQVGTHPHRKGVFRLPGTIITSTRPWSLFVYGTLACRKKKTVSTWMHLVTINVGRQPPFTTLGAWTAGTELVLFTLIFFHDEDNNT